MAANQAAGVFFLPRSGNSPQLTLTPKADPRHPMYDIFTYIGVVSWVNVGRVLLLRSIDLFATPRSSGLLLPSTHAAGATVARD